VGLAQNRVAWAADTSDVTDLSASQQAAEVVSQDKDDYCDKDANKNKERCKDKDKDRDKCKKNKKNCGTVKPPPTKVIIPVTGVYSVGGLCTISVEFNAPLFLLDASLRTPLPGELPENLQKVSQGCLLTYYSGSERIDALPSDAGTAIVCFAAPPKRNMTLYFYNNYSAAPGWEALETTVEAGRACAPGNESGIYMVSYPRP
jgi:hypothetical protein